MIKDPSQASANIVLDTGRERTLTGDFEGIVVLKKSKTSGLTVDLSALKGVDVTIVTSNNLLQFKAAAEQTNAPVVITTSKVRTGSFYPDTAIIRAGQVELRKLSPYLVDLPNEATAQLLVAPQYLDRIDKKGHATWRNITQRINQIENYHGLGGMQIFDCPRSAPSVNYEQDWANQIKSVFERVQATGRSVTTGLFLGTKEIVHGKAVGESSITLPTNLYSLRDQIAKKIPAFTERPNLGPTTSQWSSTEDPEDPSCVICIDFTNGDEEWSCKARGSMSARPVALEIECLPEAKL